MFEATTSLDSIKGRDVAHEELIQNSFQSEQAWVWSGLMEMVTNGGSSVGTMETKEGDCRSTSLVMINVSKKPNLQTTAQQGRGSPLRP